MSLDAALLLLFLTAALVSFFKELLPVDVTALCLLVALLVSGIVPLDEAIAGFSNKGVLTIGGLFVLSHSLMRTGILEIVADRISSRYKDRKWVGIGVLLVLVALMSGFLNNTAVVALTIPLAIDLCRRFRLSPSKVLIPLSFAAIFGGTLTLIGTSTNLLVSAIVEQEGGAPLGMFEFTQLGVIFLICGLGYVMVMAPRLPERAKIESLTGEFEMSGYLTEMKVREGSKLIGRTVEEVRMSERFDVTVLAIVRGDHRITVNLRAVRFQPGDMLAVRAGTSGLIRLRNEMDLALLSDVKLSDEELADENQVIVEALVGPNSSIIGSTLQELDFRRTHGGFVLAIRREEATLRERLAHTPLRFADALLVVTSRSRLVDLRRNDDLLVATELELRLKRERLWWLPLVLIPSVMMLAAVGVVDILTGVLTSVVLLLVLGVIQPQESYRSVEWRVIFFIAAFIPVGDAMFRTGLADTLAAFVLMPSALFPEAYAPWVALSVLYLVTSLATEAVTNNAAAIVLTPVALKMGTELGVDPRGMILAICFAASASFMTPTGYQTNMMVYGAGNYRFLDFTKFGVPLNIFFWILASFMIPWLFPFH